VPSARKTSWNTSALGRPLPTGCQVANDPVALLDEKTPTSVPA
jgi:hypothetical protein